DAQWRIGATLALALRVNQLLTELAVVGIGARLLHDNLLPVVGDFENDPFRALAQLQLVEGLDTLGGHGNTVGGGSRQSGC
nr:hypothetical protein [Tanacetum cinerariifolium]